MFFVYVLYSRKYKRTYTGITSNLVRRLEEHNNGKSRYTSKFGPWEIIHTEDFSNRLEARKREKYLKSSSGRRWMKEHIDWPSSSTG